VLVAVIVDQPIFDPAQLLGTFCLRPAALHARRSVDVVKEFAAQHPPTGRVRKNELRPRGLDYAYVGSLWLNRLPAELERAASGCLPFHAAHRRSRVARPSRRGPDARPLPTVRMPAARSVAIRVSDEPTVAQLLSERRVNAGPPDPRRPLIVESLTPTTVRDPPSTIQ